MIKPRDAEAHAACEAQKSSAPVRQFEYNIDAALKQAAIEGHWPCTIALTGVSDGIRRMFEREYAKVGWRTRIVYDQRDGDYLEIGKP